MILSSLTSAIFTERKIFSVSFTASAVSGDRDTSNYFYLSNKATDETYYLIVKIHDQIVGRLSAGDWMFMPWSQGDDAAEISITATNGTCAYEYAVFKSAYTLVDRTA